VSTPATVIITVSYGSIQGPRKSTVISGYRNLKILFLEIKKNVFQNLQILFSKSRNLQRRVA